MPKQSRSPTKRALLIGIDKYTLQPKVISPLGGCCNDVDLIWSILVTQYGFGRRNVSVLKNAKATRARIEAEFEQLIEQTRENDIVVVMYAGHGSQRWNPSGEEATGWDSTIVPFDSGRDPLPSTDISDDTINGWLTELGRKTPYTTLLFDSCHSGTITRDIFQAKARSAPPDMRGAATSPPTAPPGAQRSVSTPSGVGTRGAGPWPAEPDTYVVISGCRDDETSWEYLAPDGVAHGALTYFLARELQRPGRKSYRDMFEAMAPLVTAYKGQHPQMEGRGDAEVFGVDTLPPMEYVLVTGPTPNGDAIELAAGAGQRVTVGSLYDIYRPGSGKPAEADLLGRVRVARVHAVHSDAEPVGQISISDFPVNARAVEAEHAYGDLRLGVHLTQSVTGSSLPEAAALVEALRMSRKIQLVDAAKDEAHASSVVVHLIAPRASVGPGDAVPRLGATDVHTWVMADGKGEPVGPTKPLGEYVQVAKNLDTLANYRDTLALENPDSTSVLHGKFTLELMRRVPGAGAPETMKPEEFAWVAALPDAHGRIVFQEGEFIGFRVKSGHDAPVFINLLSLGLDGGIQVLYPRPSEASPMLQARGELNIRQRSRLGFEVTLSAPFLPNAPPDEAVEAVDTVKLFVTEREARFESTGQEGMRSVGSQRSTLEELLRRAYDTTPRPESARGLKVDDPPPAVVPVRAEQWTTETRRFVTGTRGTGVIPAGTGATPLSSVVTPVRVANTSASDAPAREAVTRALSGDGFTVQQTLQIVQPPARLGGRSLSTTSHVEVPGPGSGNGQMLLATDESGMMSWHFAPMLGETAPTATRNIGGAEPGTRSYDVSVPPAHARVPGEPEGRGLASAAVRKVLEVVAFPLIEEGISLLSDRYVPHWEGKRQPYGIRTFTPDDYAKPGGRVVDGAELAKGRALLMVHGTFSRAHAAFGALDKAAVERLHRKYEGRVFGFDHFTLSHDPRQNVDWLLAQLPESATLDVDIISHSRGGLVSRVLAERTGELSRTVRVGKVVFVGSPNAGTQLADPEYVGKFIDTYTNLLALVPTNGVTDVLEGILTAAKVIAVGMAKGLRGLQSMHPSGAFTSALNAKVADGAAVGDAQYFALASDFSPRSEHPALSALLANRVMDGVFKQAKNDLVVPTDSVFAENGAPRFPILQAKVFSGGDALAHTEFFASDKVREQLLNWLGA